MNGDDAFLLAEKNLEYLPINESQKEISWETSSLRSWLNTEFLKKAFTDDEENAIKDTVITNEANPYVLGGEKDDNDTTDKIYLLSINEVRNTNYGFDDEFILSSRTREAKNTAYVKGCGAFSSGNINHKGNGYWMLRTPGLLRSGFAYVASFGTGSGRDGSENVIRPVLCLKLSSGLWKMNGSVNSEDTETDEQEEIVTQTPAPTVKPSISSVNINSSKPSKSADYKGQMKENKNIMIRPTKVVFKTVKVKKKKIILKWKKVVNVKGYQIQYATSKKFKFKKVKTTAKTSYIINKLKKKKTYYIRLRAFKLNGKEKVYGKWSVVKKLKMGK